jgi:hypothetical protein
MPSEDLHSRLMAPTGVRNYVAIPTLASWKGDVVRAKQRLQQLRAEDQKAIAKQFDFHSEYQRSAFAHQFQSGLKVNPVNPAAPTSAARIKQLGFVAAVAAQRPQTRPQHVPQQPVGRVAGNLTDPYVIDAAIGPDPCRRQAERSSPATRCRVLSAPLRIGAQSPCAPACVRGRRRLRPNM